MLLLECRFWICTDTINAESERAVMTNTHSFMCTGAAAPKDQCCIFFYIDHTHLPQKVLWTVRWAEVTGFTGNIAIERVWKAQIRSVPSPVTLCSSLNASQMRRSASVRMWLNLSELKAEGAWDFKLTHSAGLLVGESCLQRPLWMRCLWTSSSADGSVQKWSAVFILVYSKAQGPTVTTKPHSETGLTQSALHDPNP